MWGGKVEREAAEVWYLNAWGWNVAREVAVVRLRGLEATWQGWRPEEYTGKADISWFFSKLVLIKQGSRGGGEAWRVRSFRLSGFRGLLNPLLSRHDTLPHLIESRVDSNSDSVGELVSSEGPVDTFVLRHHSLVPPDIDQKPSCPARFPWYIAKMVPASLCSKDGEPLSLDRGATPRPNDARVRSEHRTELLLHRPFVYGDCSG